MATAPPAPLTASGRYHQQRKHQLRGVLFIQANMVLLLALTVLDIRDLYYKTMWMGPYDSYAFDGTGDHKLDERRLLPAYYQQPTNGSSIASGQLLERASGWSSFLDPCEAMFATSFFLSAMGTNCTINGLRPPRVIVAKLVMTGTIRVDSVAWACCQLLYYHRRPGVCQERMVTRFLKRYAMEAPHVPRNVMAKEGSAAEDELLHLLSVISRSAPSHHIVCVEAFALRDNQSVYHPNIFGCGSSNVMAAAFAGSHASHLQALLGDKAWLTVDEFGFLGLGFSVRQNDKSDYTVRTEKDTALTVATHHPLMNYSSSGNLYPVLVLCDLAIAVLSLASSFEILRFLLLPQLKYYLGHGGKGVTHFRGSTWLSMVSRSLYRSPFVAPIDVVSHVISWQLIMPNSVIWAWTLQGWGRWQAILSSARAWTLILICFLWVWDLVVVVSERAAFAFASRTFITTMQAAAVCGVVAYVRRRDLLSMSSEKYALDHQRLTDFGSFANAGGYSNSYDDDLDHVRTSDHKYWQIVYGPLLRLLVYSIASIFAVLVVKMVYYMILQRSRAKTTAVSVGQQQQQQHGEAAPAKYKRMPIEKLLNIPIRASSLLRARLQMELVGRSAGRRYVYAPLYFDYGTILNTRGDMITRQGFCEAIPPCIQLGSDIHVNDMKEEAAGDQQSESPMLARLTMQLTMHLSSLVLPVRDTTPVIIDPHRATLMQPLTQSWHLRRRSSLNIPIR